MRLSATVLPSSLPSKLGRAVLARPTAATASSASASSAAFVLLPWRWSSSAAHHVLSAPLVQRCAAFHHTAAALSCRRTFSTSSLLLRTDGPDGPDGPDRASGSTGPTTTPAAVLAKRKVRSAGAKHSLRRVAVIAQQQPEHDSQHDRQQQHSLLASAVSDDGRNVISAVCVAESFDMHKVMAALQAQGYQLDPDGSGFESHEVVHGRRQWPDSENEGSSSTRDVDLFVFESGTVVGWGLPPDAVDALATGRLVATGSAVDPFVAERETETLEFRRDAARDGSAMRGDVVVLGTRRETADGHRLATTLAMIAFSSGLARSTKLAVLESAFTDYFESTRRIPEMLANRRHHRRLRQPSVRSGALAAIPWLGFRGFGGLGHLSQDFILQKTGELLSLRAQLNHYRELTDALPDIFWDARAELGLEGYYEQVGRALDVGVRIKTLNQKMDYAQEIATVLREISSERHGARLEWIIIVLITVEVVFELRRVYLEWPEKKVSNNTDELAL
ncbi:duf155 domain containing protein [Grosmannia clavigera kw1407]|uniref:Duf155 domain containing protein n=1 Tax=Grosmannia clavigera (strain kw1407 / UAMH 11150) TaxID=655863 RepID=F0XNB2_GROCL|nr:duf155 domain containing protein [Grosmannia clavigera kw1407]EFX00802.1 duf155 domain containing protein [Grosmannia clavigera kw1407]